MKAMKKYRQQYRNSQMPPYVSFRQWLRAQPEETITFRSPKVDKIRLSVEAKNHV